MIQFKRTVPTNCREEWYKKLGVLGTDLCQLICFESEDKNWVKIRLSFNAIIIDTIKTSSYTLYFKILNIITPLIINKIVNL